uniref:Pumilio domain-containing protein KIAA0020 homolog n=1 Tax=Saccoglossus kowalevskii TaxID=10224 RepID=A0ABM0GTU2_SACKO|nr:PREDICTED: pumilio domain-containing protein KIAA0020 homolog [Saccoglossus kowalevskii]
MATNPAIGELQLSCTEESDKLHKMTKKEKKVQRRKLKNNYELSKRAKEIWETLRRHNCSKETRRKLIAELYKMVQGKVSELAFAHDTVRVLQCCIQFGSVEQRNAIFEEVKDLMLDLSKNKYSKFYVLKMLKYGTKEQRDFIIKSFYGKVAKLVAHSESSEILESAYNNHANASQRISLLEEFYGPTYAVFKTQNNLTLEQILKENPGKKRPILENMKHALTPLLEKSVIKHSIVHKALMDYFIFAEIKSKTDRKAIIKSFKTFVLKICREEFGHLVMLAIFDAVDDTKLVSKVLLNEMLKDLSTIAMDTYGRKVLLYLLGGRDPSYCHPDIVKILQGGDNNPTSKKSRDVRQRELIEAASPGLLELVAKETRALVFDKSHSQLVLAILRHAKGDKSHAMNAICELAAEEFIPHVKDSEDKLDEMHIAEHPAGHQFLKRLILQDKDKSEKSEELFSNVLLNGVKRRYLVSWAKVNRSAFVLCSIMESGIQEITEKLKEILLPAKKELSRCKTKGTQLLLEKMK